MIIFKNIKSGEPLKVLTSDKISFKDGKEEKHPVKKVVITIEAGGIATMMVERYLMSEDPFVGCSSISENIKEGMSPTTFIHHYAIGDVDKDLEFAVAGPHTVNGQMNDLKLLHSQLKGLDRRDEEIKRKKQKK